MNLENILLAAVGAKADLHNSWGTMHIRYGKLQYINDERVTMEDSEALVRELTNDYQDVLVNKGVDFSIHFLESNVSGLMLLDKEMPCCFFTSYKHRDS